MPGIARPESRAGRPPAAAAVRRTAAGLAQVLGVAVRLRLAVRGGYARGVAAADYASVALGYARTDAAEDFTVLGTPAPDARFWSVFSQGEEKWVLAHPREGGVERWLQSSRGLRGMGRDQEREALVKTRDAGMEKTLAR